MRRVATAACDRGTRREHNTAMTAVAFPGQRPQHIRLLWSVALLSAELVLVTIAMGKFESSPLLTLLPVPVLAGFLYIETPDPRKAVLAGCTSMVSLPVLTFGLAVFGVPALLAGSILLTGAWGIAHRSGWLWTLGIVAAPAYLLLPLPIPLTFAGAALRIVLPVALAAITSWALQWLELNLRSLTLRMPQQGDGMA